jgi:spore coat protein U-like protein
MPTSINVAKRLIGRKWRMSYLAVSGALAALSVSFAAAAQSFTATAVMPVWLDLVGSCTVSAGDLDFGRYEASSSAPRRGQSVLELRCTRGLTVEVGLDAGQGGGSTSERRMMSGAGALRYGLYQDAARRANWGNLPGVDTIEVQTGALRERLTIFGEIPAQQQVPAGSYGDVITIHLYY